MCKSKYGIHDCTEIVKGFDTWSDGSVIMKKQYGCKNCHNTFWIMFNEKGEPHDLQLYAEIMAKDLIQPGTELFDEIYGRGRSDELLRVSQEFYEAEKKREQMRGEIEDYKKHNLKGAKHYAV